MNEQISAWEGDFGDAYTDRHTGPDPSRIQMFDRILGEIPGSWPKNVLEVGANAGLNLDALRSIFGHNVNLIGLEPNDKARKILVDKGYTTVSGIAQSIPMPNNAVDMSLTCGVLIHIDPEHLFQACREIWRVTSRYLICIEYFNDRPVMIPYRSRLGMLWKRDYGGFWMDNFDVKLVSYGFLWGRVTGVDNLTYWVFKK